MKFFRPLSKVAPAYDPALPWPLDGMAYVMMFMGPMGAIGIGLQLAGAVGLAIGGVIATATIVLNAILFNRMVDSILPKLQRAGLRRSVRITINAVGFAWAIALCAFSMCATAIVLDRFGRTV